MKAEEIGTEELKTDTSNAVETILDYTASTEWDEIKSFSWDTAEVVSLMIIHAKQHRKQYLKEIIPSDKEINATGWAMSIRIEKNVDKPQANAYAQGMLDLKELILKKTK